MPYDETTAKLVRHALSRRQGIVERKMMGALCFVEDGVMRYGVSGDSLMVRVEQEERSRVLALKNVKPLKIGSKAVRSFVLVDAAAIRTEAGLARWIRRASPGSAPGRPKGIQPLVPAVLKSVVTALATQPGVTVEKGWGSSSVALKVRGKIFAMQMGDDLVLKLPATSVDALVRGGKAKRFDPRRNGRVMKEWAVVSSRLRNRVRLAREAHAFVSAAK